MPSYNELLIGCGHNRRKRLSSPGSDEWWYLTTLDMNPNVGADVVHDLNVMPYPFADEIFDEIHAYDVVEHLGTQGDFKSFFAFFEEIHRILKKDGKFFCITPAWNKVWAWGDPGHTRIINEGTIVFLDQSNYTGNGETSMTDYRPWYKADFDIIHSQPVGELFTFVLRKK